MYGKDSHEILFFVLPFSFGHFLLDPLTCRLLGVWDGGITRVGDFHVGFAECQVGL